MSPSAPPSGPRRALIAGGGIAGIEAALALREFAGDAADVVVIDPGRRFSVPGTATGRAFGFGTGVDLRLADVVDRAAASLVGGRVASVDAGRRMVTLEGGEVLTFDALLVAVGATPVPTVPGALTFTGPREVEAVRGMMDDVKRRAVRGAGVEIAIVVPPDCGWPLAAYELALMMRQLVQAHGWGAVSIRVVTSEEAPLGLFGADTSAVVQGTLARSKIDVLTRVAVRHWEAGSLRLADGGTVRADRAIALPVYRGPAIDGLLADGDGFIPAEPDGRVPGAPGVWAVGDGTTNPIKQGGIACQQADVAAAGIVAAFGLPVHDAPEPPALRGWMWDGRQGRSLPPGAPQPHAAPAWPVAKIGGRFLAPFLHAMIARGGDAGAIGVPS